MREFAEPLPIDSALPELAATLRREPNAVLVAPPGAGKTTRVPLALLDEPWVDGGKLILLEPRRLAARGAAQRMAATLGERVGVTVGLRVRLGSKIGPRTRIEVVTEGVFARMILADPELTGIAAVLFDEFHERSLDADFGLALALDSQAGLRADVRLIAMSATLDGARVARLLGSAGQPAPVIASEGRAYPVETRYLGRDPARRIEDDVADAVMRVLRAETGSVLVFLPGQGEIRRVAALLARRIADASIDLCPLYGALDQAEQDRAVAPSSAGRRKAVLATSIAETSLTIEGVRVVVDSGLARVPRYEPDIGLTRLETVRVSRAAADQRRGRAGRTQPGVCYRLWEEAATGALQPFSTPEILSADLAPLVLDCAAWGLDDPTKLAFLDTPPAPALKEARALLVELGALDAAGRLTPLGQRLAGLPLPPRLARMIVAASGTGNAMLAADIAAVLVERGLGGDSTDLTERLEHYRRDRSRRADEMRRLAAGWARAASSPGHKSDSASPASILALAYPDRIAKARGKPGEFLMANGRGAALEAADSLAREAYLSVAGIAGGATAARILLAAPMTEGEVETAAGPAIVTADEMVFDRTARALRARRTRRLGAIVVGERPLPLPANEAAAAILANGIASLGLAALPWSKALLQWRDRVLFLRRAQGGDWPDLGDEALTAGIGGWLGPHLIGKPGLAAITTAELESTVHSLLPWSLGRRLDDEAPTHFEVPTGSRIPVEYDGADGPVLAVRVQELFGLDRHPAIAGGRVPLVLHLLSPAHRPIQITKDLPGFWRGSWASVKADMRGRYPRHSWPDDPAHAAPTRRAKPRGS